MQLYPRSSYVRPTKQGIRRRALWGICNVIGEVYKNRDRYNRFKLYVSKAKYCLFLVFKPYPSHFSESCHFWFPAKCDMCQVEISNRAVHILSSLYMARHLTLRYFIVLFVDKYLFSIYFRRFCKIARSDYYLYHVCPSVRLY